jgi:phosphatidylglycerophosphatase A
MSIDVGSPSLRGRRRPDPPVRMKPIAKLVASGLLAGYSPFAPGTAGSLLGLLIFVFFQGIPRAAWLSVTAVTFFLGIPVSSYVERLWGKDSPRIVIDEVAGFWITVSIAYSTGFSIFIGFLLFRFFDIVKPFPVRIPEKLPGGWGIMGDDLIAGIYAGIFTKIIVKFIGIWSGG